MLTGIDIASYQHPHGNPIDYTEVATQVAFVSIKATEWRPTDPYRNPYWWQDIEGFRDVNVTQGSYMWFSPFDGRTQADFYCDMVGDEPLFDDLRDMVDVEEEGADGLELFYCIDRIKERRGKYPFLYGGANPRYNKPLMQCLADQPKLAELCPLWVASYGFSEDHGPGDIAYWDDWSVWQYTSSGAVSGINALTDLDRMQDPIHMHCYFPNVIPDPVPGDKVKKMYDPTFDITKIVASCPGPDGKGALLLQEDGAVFIFHAPITVPEGKLIGANGQDFFVGRVAADIALDYDSDGKWSGTWTITTTSAETYTFPV